MGNRAKATKTILDGINEMCPGNENVALYKAHLEAMSDKEFADFIAGLKAGTVTLTYTEPNLYDKPKLSIDRNLKFLQDRKYPVYQRIWMPEADGSRTLSNYEFLVLPQVVRRQSQHALEKASIPTNNRSVDYFTGQPTGSSKGARISYPELGVLDALGLPNASIETMVFRGGDIKGLAAMNAAIAATGEVAFEQIEDRRSGVESVKTLSVLLSGAHLRNNLKSGPAQLG